MTAALRADPVARLATLAPTIGVGILTADLMALGADLARLHGSGVEILHLDGKAPAENARHMFAALRGR